ncbi:hypothetical protein SAMN04488590_0603 [Microbacterium sp. 77mftsu3.1]|nr:hypothetical protein SAMN04488590_0603 [Microbacterium sp. 77mftsu3.1]
MRRVFRSTFRYRIVRQTVPEYCEVGRHWYLPDRSFADPAGVCVDHEDGSAPKSQAAA